jgi:DNA modification methylase
MDLKIKTLQNVNNPKSVHGIYPYRGKISALDANQVIEQLPKKKILLDPFCGSGTIVYEGAKNGLDTIGVDLNPVAQVITAGKLNIDSRLEVEINAIEEIIREAQSIKKVIKMPAAAFKHFHSDSAEQIMRILMLKDSFSDYGMACAYGAICLTARGCNDYKWTSSTVGKDIEPKRKINFYEKLILKVKKHHYPLANSSSARLIKADARKLASHILPSSVDYVFTSPPYFDCLDYTAYYAKIITNILQEDRMQIRNELIQNFSSYEESMSEVLNELYKVVKKGGKVLFVVGDKKVHGKLINGAEFFNDITPFKIINTIERSYTGSSSQVFDKLNKTDRKEQIIVWEK